MMACDSGTSAAPNTPCSNRNDTICVRLCEMPHRADAATKPAMQISRKRLRPQTSVKYPVKGMKIADDTR
jgi:hypothetical protein